MIQIRDKKQIVKNSLVVLGMAFVIFNLLLLNSNKMYVMDHAVPYEVPEAIAIVGIIGMPLYMLNKTPYKYIVFSPVVLLSILIIFRSDPYI